LEKLDDSGDSQRDHRVDCQESEVIQPTPDKLDEEDTRSINERMKYMKKLKYRESANRAWPSSTKEVSLKEKVSTWISFKYSYF
jgi:hypothetical protein